MSNQIEESTDKYQADQKELNRLVRKIERIRCRMETWRARQRLELKAARMGLAAKAIPY